MHLENARKSLVSISSNHNRCSFEPILETCKKKLERGGITIFIKCFINPQCFTIE
jgi:hypothetical protein